MKKFILFILFLLFISCQSRWIYKQSRIDEINDSTSFQTLKDIKVEQSAEKISSFEVLEFSIKFTFILSGIILALYPDQIVGGVEALALLGGASFINFDLKQCKTDRTNLILVDSTTDIMKYIRDVSISCDL